MAPIVGLAKIFRRLRGLPSRQPTVDLEKTQVARLGLFEVSPLPSELAARRSLPSLVEAAEQDESDK
jgi:hypothetical protein